VYELEATMKAYPLHGFGATLVLEEVPRPEPAAGQLLVRVRATSINPYDWHGILGEPRVARVMPNGLGLRRPRMRTPGCDLAGTVEAVGPGVTGFRPGDDVYALVPDGGWAQYAVVDADRAAPMPANLSHQEAAAVPLAALTALRAVRDDAGAGPGRTVLVTGASGGVGTFAVQLARALGATVTGVCRSANADLVTSLGAADTVDYQAADVTRLGRRWDAVVDIAGSRSVFAYRRALAPGGVLVVVGGEAGRWVAPAGHALGSVALAPLARVRVTLTDLLSRPAKGDLLQTLTGFLERGEVRPVIDRVAAFEDLPAAYAYQLQGHARGKVVVTV
jgi:NADPH:quinone reductase-like Zn-dependent oxidoreductase